MLFVVKDRLEENHGNDVKAGRHRRDPDLEYSVGSTRRPKRAEVSMINQC